MIYAGTGVSRDRFLFPAGPFAVSNCIRMAGVVTVRLEINRRAVWECVHKHWNIWEQRGIHDSLCVMSIHANFSLYTRLVAISYHVLGVFALISV